MRSKSDITEKWKDETIKQANALYDRENKANFVNEWKCECQRCVTSSGQIHWRTCKACECKIDQDGCGCNPMDA